MKNKRTVLILQHSYWGIAIKRVSARAILGCPQAAAYLGVSPRWLHGWVRRSPRSVVRLVGRPLIPWPEVQRLKQILQRRLRQAPLPRRVR